jgi:adenylate cyclase
MNHKIFEQEISKEILKSERFRLYVLMIVFGILFLFTFSISVLYKDYFQNVLTGADHFLWVVSVPLLIIIRSFFIRYRIRKWQKEGYQIAEKWRYLNSFIEVSIPSAGILIFAQGIEAVYALITPLVFLYFIFIILSALELNLYLSIFTGAVAAIEYFSIALFLLNQPANVTGIHLLDFYLPYMGKSIILFASGVLAGMVTIKIKNYLISSYNRLDERNHIEKIFGQQVSPHIVDELIRSKQEIISRRRFVCIMFVDIRGFTPFSETKSPEEIVEYQNNIFSFMIERVNEHHGIINQFMGDGFMATFGAPISHDNDCQNAVNAAMDIINDLGSRNEKKMIPITKVGIGLHAGEVVTGNVGTSIRKQYSITGNVVILASRLEQLNKKYNSQILVSKEVLDRIDSEEINAKYLGLVEIKGRSDPMEIYQLV